MRDLFRSIRCRDLRHTDAAVCRGVRRDADLADRRVSAEAAGAGDGGTDHGGGDAAAGESAFFGRAVVRSCHDVNGRGGIVGPDLSNAGRLSAAAAAPEDRRSRRGRQPRRPAGGAAGVRGPARDRGEDARRTRDSRRAPERRHVLAADGGRRPGNCICSTSRSWLGRRRRPTSLHPTDYATRLSAAEIAEPGGVPGTLQGRDPSKTAAAPPLPGGLTYERLLDSHEPSRTTG